MNSNESIDIKLVSSNDNEYIIKDKFGINMGRIFIIELSNENKYCCFRMKFYKNNEIHEKAIKTALELISMSLFNNRNIYKINTIVDEDIIIQPFVELGFSLEGVLWDTCISRNITKNELIFGVNKEDFQNNNNINILRLRGKNIELKILTPEDSYDVSEYYKRNIKHLETYEPLRDNEFYTIKGQRKNLMMSYKQFLNGTSINLGIYKNKILIGKIQLTNIVRGVFQNAFVGYSIDEKEQGKGYMKEALNLVVEYAFNDMEIHRIEAGTLVDNLKSQSVLKGCGFKEIGVSEKYLFINGKWRDHKIFYKFNE